MRLFQRLFFAAMLAGLAAGIVMSGLQQWRVAPLILAAEVYEDAEAPAPDGHSATEQTQHQAAAGHDHGADEWKPANGPERIGLTVLADLLAGLGFAFVLAAASVLTGLPITAQNGVIWGLGGFLVFHLAPAFGLPPELPGMPVADLVARQVWWWGTALATAAACYSIAKFRSPLAIAVGALLLVAPHVIGAPPQPEDASRVPAHLAASFAANALSVDAAFWLILGPLYGWLFARFGEVRATVSRGAHA